MNEIAMNKCKELSAYSSPKSTPWADGIREALGIRNLQDTQMILEALLTLSKKGYMIFSPEECKKLGMA